MATSQVMLNILLACFSAIESINAERNAGQPKGTKKTPGDFMFADAARAMTLSYVRREVPPQRHLEVVRGHDLGSERPL